MCGIAGLVTFNNDLPERDQLVKMTSIMEHRGPDDTGIYIDGRAGLAFKRLSIIDLNEGHQPLCNENEKLWLVFNGEIYNYKALREELMKLGHRFSTQSDSEVIIHAYEEYGEECVKHLRGMFAFAIWDEHKGELFAARDHFGIKPFYYLYDGKRFAFASEIKSLLQLDGVRREVHIESFMQYLSFQYVPEPLTMFAGIMKLPPAHFLKLEVGGNVSLRKYWDTSFAPNERSSDDFVDELRAVLEDSVAHHMQSDVERGCFLSSGIDSTCIAAYMRKREPIRTFSVGFAGSQNETIIAAQTAKQLDTQHFAKEINEMDYFHSLRRAIWHQDEPVADPSAIALFHVAELAGKEITVVLSGEGADEIFGGYLIYREPNALKPVSWMPNPLKRGMHQIVEQFPTGWPGRNYLLRGTTPLEERFLGNAKIMQESDKYEILAKPLLERLASYRNPWQVAASYYDRARQWDDVTKMQYVDLNLWLPGDILMKADKMTMAHSLELRVPFLDKKVFELARQIPTHMRIAAGTTKHILRRSMKGVVPDEILNRPKLGFPVPLREWLHSDRGDQMLLEIEEAGIGEFIRLDTIQNWLVAHRSGKGDYSRKIWAVYVFAIWYQTFIISDGAAALENGMSVSFNSEVIGK